MRNSKKIKVFAFLVAAFLSINMYTVNRAPGVQVTADTVSDLEKLKDENNQKIKKLQDEINAAQAQYDNLEQDEIAKNLYIDSLNQKIDLQNQNIQYVKDQMDQIDADIKENQDNIAKLKVDIEKKNTDIDANMELFKQRLRASYMVGDSTIAAVFTGSADFYDVLAKYELVCKVAKHDDDLIKTLKTQLEDLHDMNQALDVRQQELDASMADAVVKKDEFSAKLNDLTIDYQNTQSELEKLGVKKTDLSQSIELKQKLAEEEEAEHDQIVAQIEAAKEQIRKAQESSIAESKRVSEEQSKAAEEEKRKQEEEEKKQQATTQAPAVTQAPSQTQPPATAAPSTQPPQQQAPPASNGMAWPVPGFYTVWSKYGYRDFDSSFHRGIDISGGGIAGAPIVAADSGVVVTVSNSCTHNYSKYSSCGCGGGYGNYLTILHNDGTYSTLYGHCQSIIVSAGQSVTKGQTIAYVGTTGYSTGNHLHFEVLKNGSNIDPESVL
ncbi:MAG: peptidoglycan DD-metalloendopeptidase family protein [Oscillospiraceae bacterium]|nr:peptidoglycan DD-metalloendopeptidase family protein [Oscillospiraceae bacterium]